MTVGQLAVLLLQSGHGEKAVALFQALLEINLFSPDFCGPGDYAFEDKASQVQNNFYVKLLVVMISVKKT